MQRRLACLFIPRFSLACEFVAQPASINDPKTVAIIDEHRILEMSPSARRYGVSVGQRLEEALAACPYLVTIEARPAYYQRHFDVILNRLTEISPRVEAGQPGVAYIDLQGLDRHYPQPGSLEQKLLACASAGFRPRLGIGPGKFPALIAAYRSRRGQSLELRASEIATRLVPVSVDLLPISFEMKRQLQLLGIETLGALAALPRHAVAARFGPEGTAAWDLAVGHDDSPLNPVSTSPAINVSRFFIDPIASRDVLVAASEQLLGQAQHLLLQRYQGTRLARLTIETENNQTWNKQITFRDPRQDRASLWAAIKPVVEVAVLPGPAVQITLELNALTSVLGWQDNLWPRERAQREERLHAALRQLKARYGACPVGRVVEVEPWSRIPERRAAIVAFDL